MDKDKNRKAALKILNFMVDEPEFDGFSFYDILHILKIVEEMTKKAFEIPSFKEATQNCIRMAEKVQSPEDSDKI